jgi:hypothetical protein
MRMINSKLQIILKIEQGVERIPADLRDHEKFLFVHCRGRSRDSMRMDIVFLEVGSCYKFILANSNCQV